MPELTRSTRRRFGQGLGAALVLAGLPEGARAETEPEPVEIRRFRFVPAELTIKEGESVVWMNHDAAPHTATATDGAWDTGALKRGERAVVRFEKAGRYRYICAYHPNMKGEVVVTPA